MWQPITYLFYSPTESKHRKISCGQHFMTKQANPIHIGHAKQTKLGEDPFFQLDDIEEYIWRTAFLKEIILHPNGS